MPHRVQYSDGKVISSNASHDRRWDTLSRPDFMCDVGGMIKKLSARESASRRKSSLSGFLPAKSIVMVRSKTSRAVATKSLARSVVTGPDSLEKISQDLEGCMRCKLGKTRTKLVFGEGNPNAKILFVGEGPGEQEDLHGRPFIGRAGQLLDKMIEAMGLKREQVYIANVVKCRPPDNRFPETDEISTCSPFVLRQIAAIQPKVIVPLGKCATEALMGEEVAISKIRGKFVDFNGTPLLPTFHPSYLLRNPAAKKEVWEDLQTVAKKIGHVIPKRAPEGAKK